LTEDSQWCFLQNEVNIMGRGAAGISVVIQYGGQEDRHLGFRGKKKRFKKKQLKLIFFSC